MAPILVIGATGTVGRELVRELIERGSPVRALVRDEERARSILVNSEIDYVVGDLSDKASVARAASGCGQLFLLTRDGPQQVTQASDAAQAAVSDGLQHIVKLSSSSAGPEALFAWAKEHYAIEMNIEALGVEFSHLRAHYFIQNLLGAIRREGEDLLLELPMGTGRISPIDVRDVASCAATLLVDGRSLGLAAIITGGSSFTMEEAAAVLSGSTGWPVKYRDMPPSDHLARLRSRGVESEQAESISMMYQWGRDGRLDRITDEVKSITGRPPRSLQEFAIEVAAPFLARRFGPYRG